MLSFRVDETEARRALEWAGRLGVDRSEFLREALRRHIDRLATEAEADTAARLPRTVDEQALDAADEWGPAEDWSDWYDAGALDAGPGRAAG